MPCSLLSGLPGNGKTLRLLSTVEQLRRDTGRPVYFFDIRRKGSALADWIPLGDESTFGRRKEGIEPDLSQVKRWHEVVPSGSIMVIDEAWFVFPKRGPSSSVPKHVEELATHRHRGIDIFLSSQHAANQLDHFVRGLIQSHEHVIRLMGMERARIHKWDQGIGDPSDYHSRKASVTELWKYPRQVYDWYQSAEVHTIKRSVPLKPFLTIGGGIAAICALAFLAYYSLFGGTESSRGTGDPSSVARAGDTHQAAGGHGAEAGLERFIPTVPAVPLTAPIYADAIKVVSVPQVAGCGMITIGRDVNCWCSTQQGTRVEMSTRECIRTLKAGNFRFDRPDDYYPKFEPYMPPLAPPMPYDDGGSSSVGEHLVGGSSGSEASDTAS